MFANEKVDAISLKGWPVDVICGTMSATKNQTKNGTEMRKCKNSPFTEKTLRNNKNIKL